MSPLNVATCSNDSSSQRLAAALATNWRFRAKRWAWGIGLASVIVYAAYVSEILSFKLVQGLPKLGQALWLMLQPSGFDHLPEFAWALCETVAMAFLGTLLGSVCAVFLALFCARTTFPLGFFRFGFRRIADGFRTFDHLIWALVFVRAIGLGPIAGILAIALVDAGNLAKLYSEAIDNSDPKPIEGVRASGGSKLDGLCMGLLPQVLPNILSTTLYMFESNTRSATILGIVGAGGIGYQLADRLRVYEFGQASLMIIMIIGVVYLIDMLSGSLRRMLIGRQGR